MGVGVGGGGDTCDYEGIDHSVQGHSKKNIYFYCKIWKVKEKVPDSFECVSV
jgi:hypothetical protein